MKQTPMLFVGGLSKRVFLATRWHTEGGSLVADEKHDVTDQFVTVALELNEDWFMDAVECRRRQRVEASRDDLSGYVESSKTGCTTKHTLGPD